MSQLIVRAGEFAFPARFLVGCLSGHLDEFPYVWFVHEGGPCGSADYPALKMTDLGLFDVDIFDFVPVTL